MDTTAPDRDKSADRFAVHYRVTVDDNRSIEAHAEDIAIEQTVETPPDCIPHSHFEQGITGTIEEIARVDSISRIYNVVMSYRCDITAYSLPQFLNVLFGNISMKNNIRITAIQPHASLRRFLPGPRFGIDGVRRLLGVYERPLTCTALKPMGLAVEELAAMAGEYARGGIDIIKDDHSIADQHFHRFYDRVSRCWEAIAEANATTGRHCVYCPMISGSFPDIEKQVRFCAKQGIEGVLLAPLLVGMDFVRYCADTYNMIILGHPALSGSFVHDPAHGMTPAVLWGTLFRLCGVDASIFPNAGGRFPISHQECMDLADALRRPLGNWSPAFPEPAGGMAFDKLDTLAHSYGPDTIFLIGGALMQRAGLQALAHSTKEFLDVVRAHFGERLSQPQTTTASSCEVIQSEESGNDGPVMRCTDFSRAGRRAAAYKQDSSLPFQGITRHELIGSAGSSTSFDLRYFEIEPGGYSSLEKHVHEHVVIGVRGNGVLVNSTGIHELGVHDIAYVKPLEQHQLRNNGDVPFGFYCIVDRKRDRPIAVDRM